MTDLSMTIAPKSDQLNADDLIGKSRTIKITRVAQMKEPEQPIAIYFEGDNNKPYKPGKSMRRVLVNVWGGDGNLYIGRSMTLYRDDKVQFGGMAVGGIRISHMSDITRVVTMALTETRASRKPFSVKPLLLEETTRADPAAVFADAKTACQKGQASWNLWWKSASKDDRETLKPRLDELKAILAANAPDDPAPSSPSTDWPNELDLYAGDLGELEDLTALNARIASDGARFVDAPDDIRAEATKIEGAERARVERAAA